VRALRRSAQTGRRLLRRERPWRALRRRARRAGASRGAARRRIVADGLLRVPLRASGARGRPADCDRQPRPHARRRLRRSQSRRRRRRGADASPPNLIHNSRMSTPATFRDRRARLSKALGSGLVLFLGNDEVGMNYAANVYPFRQDSTFLYFWALDQPGLAAVIDVDARTETIFGDDVTMAAVVWSGPQPTMKSRAAEAGVKKTAPAATLADVVQAAMKKKRPVHFLAPYRAEHAVKLSALTGIKPAKLRDKRSAAFHNPGPARRW